MKQRQPAPEYPILHFETPEEWRVWLEDNHSTQGGIWMRFVKKASPLRSLSYAQALEVALCFGWIDGQTKTHDADSWVQKFTPRRARSLWSKVNRDKVLALIERGQMHSAGLAEVERAKADGRWDAAYDSQSNSEAPPELIQALDQNPGAKEFFETLNKANRYAITFRLQTAKKAETRAKRLEQIMAMLEKGEKFHP